MKKVLIICAGLQFGGVERFAANTIKFAPAEEFQFDYLIFEGLGDAFAPEIIEKGGRVITFPSPQQGYRSYIKKLGKLIDENHYAVVHSHTQFNSGLNLWVAKKHGVPIRIAHSHTTAHENKISSKQRIYENAMRKLVRRSATHLCACGVEAGKWMYSDHPFTVISNGIDTGLFAYNESNRLSIRKQYGIANDTLLVGHSGTISKLKNQELLIRLLPEIRKKKNTELLLLGTCPNQEEIQRLKNLASELGIIDCVHFAGAVMNVNEHLSALDVFAFPSLREGTPLALIEAQANGLPCIISNNIASDALLTDLVNPITLSDEEAWINALSRAKRNQPEEYADIIKESGYDAREAYGRLFEIYRR